MGDIKLFRIDDEHAVEIPGESSALEKSLQQLMERHLQALLGVRFLATEHSTGKKHAGRIDTLGIDENGAPVIIEYKRALNENVTNQGLFYLDWLLDHRADFKLLVMEKLGAEAAQEIEWDDTRLLCIAGDFTRYDVHAVAQIDRNIELLRYKRYGHDMLLLELVNVPRSGVGANWPAAPKPVTSPAEPSAPTGSHKSVAHSLQQADPKLRDLFEELRAFACGLGDDVQLKELKYYFAFRRIKNFACVEVKPKSGCLLAYLKLDPSTEHLREGFTRDVSALGHYGTGDLEVTIRTHDDLKEAHALLTKSYEGS